MYFSYKLKDHKATRTRKPCCCHDVRRADFQMCTSVRAAPALDSPIPVSGSEPHAAGQVASSARLTRTEDTSPIFEVTVCPPGGVCQPRAALPQLGPGFLTSGDTGGSCRQEPCGEARRGARPWPCSWPRRCRGGWGLPGALPVSTHSKTSANQCFWRRTSLKYSQDKATVLKVSHFALNEQHQKQLAHFPRVRALA